VWFNGFTMMTQTTPRAIHWRQRTQVGFKHESYTDVTTYTVPFSGEYDQKAMSAALWRMSNSRPSTGLSGYGNTTFSLLGLDPQRPNHILVKSSFYVGD